MGWFKSCKDDCHDYRPRYDEVEMNRSPKLTGGSGEYDGNLAGTLEAFRRLCIRNVYVCDICIHCGKTIKRDAK
jgi:hypothetical protein